MGITAYATLDDLGAYLGAAPPADSQRMLARAQELIDDALISSPYLADANGNPTDAGVLAALNKATCAQVEYWITNGDELGQLEQYHSYSIEGITVARGAASSSQDICDRAKAALRAGKLLPGAVTIT
jgi:hypothetical protein